MVFATERYMYCSSLRCRPLANEGGSRSPDFDGDAWGKSRQCNGVAIFCVPRRVIVHGALGYLKRNDYYFESQRWSSPHVCEMQELIDLSTKKGGGRASGA